MDYSLTTLRELSFLTMPKVCTLRFLALVRYQKIFFESTLRMLLELFFITSSHLFGSLFSKLESHDGKFGTCLSIILCLTGLCEGTKLEVRAGIDLICQYYEGITGSNTVAFTGGGARNVRTDLSATKDIVNIEIIEDLLYLLCDNGGEDKVPSGITDSFGRETFLNIFLQRGGL